MFNELSYSKHIPPWFVRSDRLSTRCCAFSTNLKPTGAQTIKSGLCASSCHVSAKATTFSFESMIHCWMLADLLPTDLALNRPNRVDDDGERLVEPLRDRHGVNAHETADRWLRPRFGGRWWPGLRPISAYSVSTVRASEKCSIIANRKSTTRFPTSYRWSAYVTPNSSKGWLNKRICCYL